MENQSLIFMSNYSLRSSVVDRQPLSPFRGSISESISAGTQPSSILSENNCNNEDEDMDSFLPGIFSGTDGENPKDWIRNFELFCTLKGLQPEARKAAFALSLRGIATRWYDLLDDGTRNDKTRLHEAFISRFSSTSVSQEEKMRRFWTATQDEKEAVRNFVDRMRAMASEIDVEDPILTTTIQSGLKPSVKQHVVRQKPQTVSELLEHALLAESTDFTAENSMNDVTAAIRRLEEKFDKAQIAAVSVETNRRPSSPRQSSDHRFDRRNSPEQDRYSFPPNNASSQNNQYARRKQSPSPFRSLRSRNPSVQRSVVRQDPDVGQQKFVSYSEQCYRCLGEHEALFCPFKTLVCRFCSVRGHIMRACRKRQAQGQVHGSRGYNQGFEY